MKTTLKTVQQAMLYGLIGLVVLGALLFVPAGTFDYWQAWVFVAMFTLATVLPTIYLARNDPAALQRRMHGGPQAETRTVQKIVILVVFVGLFGMVVFSALDHRFGWSTVPAAVSLVGDALVVAGLVIGLLTVAQNSYAAATIQVEADQKLASKGLYSLVRHPMYAGNVLLMVGMPLALGSYWALLLVAPIVVVLIFRILDEEKMLSHELAGYPEYAHQVRYRLLPYVW
jgi:protein-S-isoprenylcysteine O-methyltransferase Ste14